MTEKMRGAETWGTHHQGDEVALEADTLYIHTSGIQILGIRFVLCILLTDGFIKELLSEAKELAKWQALFADLIQASETQGMPPWLQNASTVGSKTLAYHFVLWEESEQDSWPLHQTNWTCQVKAILSANIPKTPEVVDMGFGIDPRAFEEVRAVRVPQCLDCGATSHGTGHRQGQLSYLGFTL
jgi:hypothetical protein